VLFGLYAIGLGSALLIAAFMKRTVLKGPQAPLFLELPKYRWPSASNLLYGLIERGKVFVQNAGTVILFLSLMLWFLSSYPKDVPQDGHPAIYHSYAGHIGRFIEPALRPLGFDWKISVSLIPGFAAREVMVAGLTTVYALEGAGEGSLEAAIKSQWTLPTALSLLLWYVFAPQCMSTLAVVRRETQSWKWPLFQFTWMLALAYGASFLVFQLTTLWGWV
jgi:ferrous iron transport protein B